ncbi:MAG: hypothetical protein M1820_003623 [Bogoriella megaspora]|nr:MAG: hypothetical protein M1820_003623 [Bogoriella megaspora]
MWNIMSDAFGFSNEDCEDIPSTMSLKDFFNTKLKYSTSDPDERDLIMLLVEAWGGFIGDVWEKQSLKWFWMEECLNGENLFVTETHEAILQRVAASALQHAEIQLSTKAKSIEGKREGDEDPSVIVWTENHVFEFDEVVVTVPTGCLKSGTPSFVPAIPRQVKQAIEAWSYSSLEKVYIAFPSAFWESRATMSQSQEMGASVLELHSPSFVQFLRPTYVPEEQKFWPIEPISLSSGEPFGDQARPTLLFSIYGPCANHVTSLTKALSPTSSEYFDTINEFFRPYYSLLPGYEVNRPECMPTAVLATNWQNDELAGNGAYTNFKVNEDTSEEEWIRRDESIRSLREGLPDRGIWFAGEHTAPFIAVGTSTGAYWSGEVAATKILGANGLLERRH